MKAASLWSFAALFLVVLGAGAVGCQKEEEKVFQVETPGMNIEATETEDGLQLKVENEDEAP